MTCQISPGGIWVYRRDWGRLETLPTTGPGKRSGSNAFSSCMNSLAVVIVYQQLVGFSTGVYFCVVLLFKSCVSAQSILLLETHPTFVLCKPNPSLIVNIKSPACQHEAYRAECTCTHRQCIFFSDNVPTCSLVFPSHVLALPNDCDLLWLVYSDSV